MCEGKEDKGEEEKHLDFLTSKHQDLLVETPLIFLWFLRCPRQDSPEKTGHGDNLPEKPFKELLNSCDISNLCNSLRKCNSRILRF